MAGNNYLLEVKPQIPEQLSQLPLLANDLLYSGQNEILALFKRLDEDLFEDCGHNPSKILRRVDQSRLDAAAQDADYLKRYDAVLKLHETYHQSSNHVEFRKDLDSEKDLIAYFCTEFGFHESLPIYSGGLGILAGDHCKAASDFNIPFVGVGLLYHQGFFTQTIDPEGNQIAHNHNQYFGHLPVKLLSEVNDGELHTQVTIQGRCVTLRVWQVNVGRVRLFLLDSDVECNTVEDRHITSQLYGGHQDTRIKQEIILGIGGVKALRKLGLNPNVWHINEGHSAFQILERSRELVELGYDFDHALEWVASNTVFTTHTPVAAGHDNFSRERMLAYFKDYSQQINIDFDKLMSLGASPMGDRRFNMTALALRGSRLHNGVSKIHGAIASRMETYIWPEVPPEENPITSITNGVHVQSILNRRWSKMYDEKFPGWKDNLVDQGFWQSIDTIPDEDFWQLHQSIKRDMLSYIRKTIIQQHKRNDSSRSLTKSCIRHMDEDAEDMLVIGFARRFATYKRATLLFSDPQRLAKIVNNDKRPVMIVFAGKAHPHDEPGKQLLREIHHYAQSPEFIGKIILLEGYDMALARHLVAGSDAWLNTPLYPLEACGTSGIKAAVNGVVNLSIADGWWGEGYNGENGWAIESHTEQYGHDYRNEHEANDLYDLLENDVVPAYYDREIAAYPSRWIRLSKNSIKTVTPLFSSHRMLRDYIDRFYLLAKRHGDISDKDSVNDITQLIEWKNKIRHCWPNVGIYPFDKASMLVDHGTPWKISVAVNLNGLDTGDVVVECLFGETSSDDNFTTRETHVLTPDPNLRADDSSIVYSLELDTIRCGLHHYKVRIYPYHTTLCNRFETGCMRWL